MIEQSLNPFIAMPQLIIEKTPSTPEIHFDSHVGIYSIEGMSTTLDAFAFYKVPVEWVRKNQAAIKSQSVFRFHLPYFNSASAKGLMLLMQMIKQIITNGTALEIIWHADIGDEFMIEAGESYRDMLGLDIRIQESGQLSL